jgi:hypothetical protein
MAPNFHVVFLLAIGVCRTKTLAIKIFAKFRGRAALFWLEQLMTAIMRNGLSLSLFHPPTQRRGQKDKFAMALLTKDWRNGASLSA